MEVYIWKLAYGLPRPATVEVDHEARFEALREATRERFRSMDPASLRVFTALSLGVSLKEALRSEDLEQTGPRLQTGPPSLEAWRDSSVGAAPTAFAPQRRG